MNLSHNYYVVFKSSNTGWNKYLKKGFNHVQLIYPTEHFWVLIDPLNACLTMKVLWDKIADKTNKFYCDLPNILSRKCKVLKIITNIKHKNSPSILLRLRHCVSEIKYILGINKSFIYTPYGLYKWLLKQNNVEEIIFKEKSNGCK